MNLREALAGAVDLLANSPAAETGKLDADLLLAHVLGRSREYLYTWPEKPLTDADYESFMALCRQRADGYPLAYLTGTREFWNLELKVSPDVLIPRPETELLVELTLTLLDSDANTLADLGTGSGAVALALACEMPHWRILACDISAKALEVAQENALRHDVSNVRFLQGAWCEAFSETGLGAGLDVGLDAIVANPPYIAPDDPHLDSGDIRYEPRQALVSGDNGLADISTIAREATTRLKPGGLLLFEHGHSQGEAVRGLLSGLGYQDIETRRDLAGHERATFGRMPTRK